MTGIIRKSLAGLTIAGIASLGLVAGGSAPASAETATTLGNVPSCVAVWLTRGWVRQTGHARNDCGYRLRYRIDWAYGPDGTCHTADPGQTITSRIPKLPRRFNGAVYC